MKKLLLFCTLIFFLCILTPLCFADEYSEDFRYSVEPKDPLLSEDTELNDPESVKNDLSFGKIFSYLFRQFKGALGDGLKSLTQGIALVLLSVVVSRCSGNIQNQNLQLLFSFIVSLSIALMCQSSLRNCALALQKAIEDMGVFTTACIPSFSVVMITAGEGGAATVFSTSMVLLGEVGTLFSKSLLLPLTDVYLSIGICSAVSDEYNFAAVSRNLRRFIIWAVGILVLIFRTVLKMQTGLASAGDQITRRYIRTAVGGLIPMVGNTLSQGVDGLFTVAAGVKTSFAIAGVLIVLSLILPALIQIGVQGLIWSLCRWISAFMNDTTMNAISDVLANGFNLMLALGGSVALMGLFSFFGIMTQVT